jgi:adenine-specific DNA-methyltransferase
LVLNRAGYQCSNAIHSVVWRHPQRFEPAAIAVGYLTSLTAVLAEIHGRRYGGGVLKIEPGALRGLPVPVVNSVADVFDEINSLMRRGKEESARSAADEVVLRCALGLSRRKVSWLERARHALSKQRVPSRNGGRDA